MNDPRIILFDIEIIPDLKKALKYWTKLSSFPGKTLRASVSSICCIGWKVFGEAHTHCINAWDFPEWESDVNHERKVLESFLSVIEGADLVVSHNGKGFDFKYIQTKFLLHSLNLLDPRTPHVDTRQLSSRNFFFIDNKLQTLAEEIFDESKLEHEGWQLWVDTHGRKAEALEKMTLYCKQDVDLLEKIFRKMRPVAKGIPNHNLFSPFKERACPTCGSTLLHKHGKHRTKTKVYQRYRCTSCGSMSQSDAKDELLR